MEKKPLQKRTITNDRIVYLLSTIDIRYNITGAERYTYENAKFLRENGIDSRILVPDKSKGAVRLRKDYKEVVRYYLAIPKIRIKNNVTGLTGFGMNNYSGLPKNGIIYFLMSIYDYLPNLFLKPKGQKYVMGSGGMFVFEGNHISKNHRLLERLLNCFLRVWLNTGDRRKNIFFHVITDIQRGYLMKQLGISSDRIFYIPLWVDTTKFRMNPKSGNQLKVMHIGGKGKNSGMVLEIANKIAAEGRTDEFEFCFLGRGNGLTENPDPKKNVSVLANVTDEQKAKVIAKSDVIVVPHPEETFSFAMLEGLASGLVPVVSESNPAIDKIIGAGAVAYKAKSIRDYIVALNAIARLKKRKDYDRRRKVNREIAVRTYDKKVVHKSMMDMFTKVLES
jgi:glycosyltransferase involved in cell wall biosynthesis